VNRKWAIVCLPLLLAAGVSHFLISYAGERWRIASGVNGFLFSSGTLFGLSCICAGLLASRFPHVIPKLAVFFAAFILQLALAFYLFPPAATAEMMGLANRYRSELPLAELRLVSLRTLELEKSGGLKLIAPKSSSNVWGNSKQIENDLLTPSLKKNFKALLWDESPWRDRLPGRRYSRRYLFPTAYAE
jgi:hypothetical protein